MGDTVSAKKGQNHFKIQHTRNPRYASTAFFRIILEKIFYFLTGENHFFDYSLKTYLKKIKEVL
jgi:hypothetical protein